MKATDKHSCESGPRVLLRAAIDLGVVLSDLWQLWCGEEKCSSPRQARDSGGLAQAEADCGPGMELGDCLPSHEPFFLPFISPSFLQKMLAVKTRLSTKASVLVSIHLR